MQAVENKVVSRIYGNGRGWAFFKNDFSDLGSADSIDQALSSLVKKRSIRRVMRGVYDYPKFSKLLKKEVPTDIDQVAQALARKFGWSIQVSGNTALNVLGLTTQIPGQYLYLSDGKTIDYQVGKQKLCFKKTTLKDIGLKYPESELVVQAIKALDKKQLNEKERQMIKDHFDKQTQVRILKDTRFTTSWVYEEIKAIFKDKS
jgi:hypothetical protein